MENEGVVVYRGLSFGCWEPGELRVFWVRAAELVGQPGICPVHLQCHLREGDKDGTALVASLLILSYILRVILPNLTTLTRNISHLWDLIGTLNVYYISDQSDVNIQNILGSYEGKKNVEIK